MKLLFFVGYPVRISGNERADSAARAALQKEVSNFLVSYTDTYQYISWCCCRPTLPCFYGDDGESSFGFLTRI